MAETTQLMVSKEEFERYCNVQDAGLFNMLSPQAMQMVGISKEKYFYILKNYQELKDLYS